MIYINSIYTLYLVYYYLLIFCGVPPKFILFRKLIYRQIIKANCEVASDYSNRKRNFNKPIYTSRSQIGFGDNNFNIIKHVNSYSPEVVSELGNFDFPTRSGYHDKKSETHDVSPELFGLGWIEYGAAMRNVLFQGKRKTRRAVGRKYFLWNFAFQMLRLARKVQRTLQRESSLGLDRDSVLPLPAQCDE